MRTIGAALLALLMIGCDEGGTGDNPATSSTLMFGNTGLPASGLPYVASRPEARAVSSGRTGATGTFRFVPGDTVTFYLDDAGTVPLASVLLNEDGIDGVNLFEMDFADSDANFPRNLALLMASLDGQADVAGLQVPARVTALATQHAVALGAALQASSIELLVTEPAVLALLAALDDPATPANEGRGADELKAIGASLDVYGFEDLLPFADRNGVICATGSIKPGCTFSRTGARLTVAADPHYNRYGYGSDDIWYVRFDLAGKMAAVYDDLGNPQGSKLLSEFAGYIGISTIGAGDGPGESEDISGGTYWLGQTGVLYSANQGAANFGQAIN